MPGRFRRLVLLTLAALTVSLGLVGNAGAQLTPPWCGTPENDAAGNLPDGSSPTHPVGSFPHIPYYAIKCTLDQIESQEIGNRMSVEQIGVSATGRPLYGVVINALETPEQQRDYSRWQAIRALALDNPAQAQELLEKWGDDIKVPIFNQSGIHGNEYEGVESNMQLIKELATTPYGVDPKIDSYLDHMILVFNIIHNPDGRVAGTRTNGNGFDLNRDWLTQSQSETKASVALQLEWLAPELLDLHGYVTPTLVESTTKPHAPQLEYDLILQWNPRRSQANADGLAEIGFGTTRPILDWCPEGDFPDPGPLCADGSTPGPAVAEGWDDWGPFYTGQYAQLTGFDSSTVEMCNRTDFLCGLPGSTTHQRGRLGAYMAQRAVTLSTMDFMIENRNELLDTQMEVYRRGVTAADRPACCPAPYDLNNNWMREFNTAYVIPMGAGQRSAAEANRLVDWLLFNSIEVHELRADYTFGGQTFQKGSYVVWLNQALRGLADTALNIGDDISASISQLYAPPGAWSHGYLWGADTVAIPDNAAFSPLTTEINRPRTYEVGVEAGRAEAYALELDSASAVRALNALTSAGVTGKMALEPFPAQTGGTLPAGTVLYAADHATKVKLATAARQHGLLLRRIVSSAIPDETEPITGVPRIAVLTAAVNQDVWSLRNLGFKADPISTAAAGALNNPALPDPLLGYDVIWNTAAWPAAANQATARARLTAFFANGGGYLGAGANGANFLNSGAQTTGLTVATRGGNGRSGIIRWTNEGGVSSPIVGSYPAADTAIVDPPAWFTGVPSSFSVDARLATTNFFLSGLWLFDAESAGAPGSPLVVHGMNATGTSRLVNFAMNPLYRADPEREWPMVGAGAYWAEQ